MLENDEFLVGILELFHDFNRRDLKYCHWKSNLNLDRSLKGFTDFDLLIDQSQEGLFQEIIKAHDIKAIAPIDGTADPAIQHFLGLDKHSGRLFHLHVHFQLILGEQFIKNYHVPLEQAMLADTQTSLGDIKIPDPNRELIILVIRSLLKYRDRDVIKDLFSVRSPGIPEEIKRELYHLQSCTTYENISKTVTQEMNVVSPELVIDFLETVSSSPRNGSHLFKLRTRMRNELSGYQLRSRWKASSSYYKVLLRNKFPNMFRKSNKKQPLDGGITVAFIGADGAGKSTLINSIQAWLSWKLNVTRLYMGSQEPSILTLITRYAAHSSNRVYHFLGRRLGFESWISKSFNGFNSFTRNLYDLGIARDRAQRFLEGQRKSSAGTIVIFDRYPIREIHEMMPARPMDGPRINKRGQSKPGFLSEYLSGIEVDLYQRIMPPDHVFILNVSPEVSKSRKPDHDFQVIQNKSQVINQFNKENLSLTEIDADQDFDQVLINTKLHLWELL